MYQGTGYLEPIIFDKIYLWYSNTINDISRIVISEHEFLYESEVYKDVPKIWKDIQFIYLEDFILYKLTWEL